MRKSHRRIATIFTGLLLANGMSCGTKIKLGQWTIQHPAATAADLSWTTFTWSHETWGGRSVERSALFIPVAIAGLPQECCFQLDLGSNLTLLQANVLRGVLAQHPDLNRLVQPNVFKDLALSFGGTQATTPYCWVQEPGGEGLPASGLADAAPLRLGTLGTDLFQHRILVIDYPNQRLAVCEALPASLHPAFTAMTLDEGGRVLLPLRLQGKTYTVLFDTGSSAFPLVVAADQIDTFSTAPGTDTLAPSAWGTTHHFIGRPLQKRFELAGHPFSGTMVYADPRPETKTNGYDAVAGNALFWDKTVVIDFKHQRFGVQ